MPKSKFQIKLKAQNPNIYLEFGLYETAVSSFFFFRKSLKNSNKIPNNGIDKTYPKNPQSLPPTTKEIKTKTGDKSKNFLERIGVTILFSIC